MKLYQHYKNKPYKFVGLARYSETSEEMVIYETRYESPGGKVWVRPKNMFFESVEVDGRIAPRFREVPLEIVETENVSEADIGVLAPLIEKAFGKWDPKWFFEKLSQYQKFHLAVGYVGDEPVGFKLGYEKSSTEFYSWLGAVDPEFRGLGIAGDLMKCQHDWCRGKGYSKISTKTRNRFREMLILNLRHGFEVVDVVESSDGGSKIVLEKRL